MAGLFLLNEIKTSTLFKNGEFGIFRDDEQAVIQSKSPRSAETTSKALRKIFDKWRIIKIAIYAPRINLIGCASCSEWQKSSVQ